MFVSCSQAKSGANSQLSERCNPVRNPCLALPLILTRSNFLVQYYRIHTDILKIVIYLFSFLFLSISFQTARWMYKLKHVRSISHPIHIPSVFFSIPGGIRIGNGNDEKHLFFRSCRTYKRADLTIYFRIKGGTYFVCVYLLP